MQNELAQYQSGHPPSRAAELFGVESCGLRRFGRSAATSLYTSISQRPGERQSNPSRASVKPG